MGEHRRLRILAVSSVLLQHEIYGGMERYFDWVLRGLAELGHSIRVATTRLGQDAFHLADGIEIMGLPVAVGRKGRPWERELRVFFENNADSSDVVLSNASAAYPLETDRVPIVALMHGTDLVDLISSFRLLAAGRGPLRTCLKEVLRLAKEPTYFSQRRLLRGCRGLAAVSEETRKSLETIYRLRSRRIDVIPAPVDTALFHPGPKREAVPVAVGAPLRILSAGSLTRQKGFDVLLDALALLDERRPGCFRLSIAGQGREMQSLRGKCKQLQLEPIVDFCGRLDQRALSDMARQQDLFVLATLREEGYPVVISEAMASGLPVVATRAGGNPTAVRNGRDGLLVDTNDVHGLAEAIEKLTDDSALRAQMAKAARFRAEAELDWRVIARSVENVLVRVAQAPR